MSRVRGELRIQNPDGSKTRIRINHAMHVTAETESNWDGIQHTLSIYGITDMNVIHKEKTS
jgi:hypothetical protein